jgi:L-asparagine transporter-like permease
MKTTFLNWVALILSLVAFIIIIFFKDSDLSHRVAMGIVAVVLVYVMIRDIQKRKMKQ